MSDSFSCYNKRFVDYLSLGEEYCVPDCKVSHSVAVECDTCRRWYHPQCINMNFNDQVIVNNPQVLRGYGFKCGQNACAGLSSYVLSRNQPGAIAAEAKEESIDAKCESVRIAVTHNQIGFKLKNPLPVQATCQVCANLALGPCFQFSKLYCAVCLRNKINNALSSSDMPWTTEAVEKEFSSPFFTLALIEIVCNSCCTVFPLGNSWTSHVDHMAHCAVKCYLCQEPLSVLNYKAHLAGCVGRIITCPWAEYLKQFSTLPSSLETTDCKFSGNKRDLEAHLQETKCVAVKKAFLAGCEYERSARKRELKPSFRKRSISEAPTFSVRKKPKIRVQAKMEVILINLTKPYLTNPPGVIPGDLLLNAYFIVNSQPEGIGRAFRYHGSIDAGIRTLEPAFRHLCFMIDDAQKINVEKIVVVIGDNGESANDRRMLFLYVGAKMACSYLQLPPNTVDSITAEDFVKWEIEFNDAVVPCTAPVYYTSVIDKPLSLYKKYLWSFDDRNRMRDQRFPDWASSQRIKLFEEWIEKIWCKAAPIQAPCINLPNSSDTLSVRDTNGVDSDLEEIEGFKPVAATTLLSLGSNVNRASEICNTRVLKAPIITVTGAENFVSINFIKIDNATSYFYVCKSEASGVTVRCESCKLSPLNILQLNCGEGRLFIKVPIKHFPIGDDYLITVAAENSFGRGPASDSVRFCTRNQVV